MACKLQVGEVLAVAKLDRLGRNASDIGSTVEELRTAGIRVVVLDMPVMDVTSAAGDLVRRMFAASPRSSGINWQSGRTPG